MDEIEIKEVVETTPEAQPVKVTTKVPRILVELFVYGVEKDKNIIKERLDELQKQMGKARKNLHKVRILWYVDKGEMSVQEKIEWFKENGKCKYFMAIDGTSEIPKEFIKNILKKIRTFETSFKSLRSSEILVFPKKNWDEDESE